MPGIDERDAAAARAILRESEELKNVLEKELLRLENNETFVADEFQKGVVRTDRFVSHGQWACKHRRPLTQAPNIGAEHLGAILRLAARGRRYNLSKLQRKF
jgi:hypothetical protein